MSGKKEKQFRKTNLHSRILYPHKPCITYLGQNQETFSLVKSQKNYLIYTFSQKAPRNCTLKVQNKEGWKEERKGEKGINSIQETQNLIQGKWEFSGSWGKENFSHKEQLVENRTERWKVPRTPAWQEKQPT